MARYAVAQLDEIDEKACEPRGWELWTPLVPLYEADEYAAARAAPVNH